MGKKIRACLEHWSLSLSRARSLDVLRNSEHAHLLGTILKVLLLNPFCITLQLLTLLWLCGLKPYFLLLYLVVVALVALWNEDRNIKRKYGL